MRFYEDREALQAAVLQYGSNMAIAQAHGLSESTIRKWRKRHGLVPHPQSPKKLGPEPTGDEWLIPLLKKQGDTATVEELADAADVSPKRIREAAERLGVKGYRVEEEDARVILHRVPPPSRKIHKALFRGKTVRFGVVSDTHIGSKACRLEELHHAYRILGDEGITTVYHPGDLICGIGIFPGQVNEVDYHTYDEQIQFAVENYPRVEGITTQIIGGNHDLEGQAGKVGLNPVMAFCHQRDDFEYLDDFRATIELEQGTRIYLLHPKGSMGYAADYKVRKLAEGFEGGAKPNVMLIGHFHRRFDIEARGIQCLGTGCFEGATSFGQRLGLSDPAVGFHIVEMTVADDGSVVKWNAEWFKFWPGRSVQKAA